MQQRDSCSNGLRLLYVAAGSSSQFAPVMLLSTMYRSTKGTLLSKVDDVLQHYSMYTHMTHAYVDLTQCVYETQHKSICTRCMVAIYIQTIGIAKAWRFSQTYRIDLEAMQWQCTLASTALAASPSLQHSYTNILQFIMNDKTQSDSAHTSSVTPYTRMMGTMLSGELTVGFRPASAFCRGSKSGTGGLGHVLYSSAERSSVRVYTIVTVGKDVQLVSSAFYE
eukprot:6656-Heterococcus_DN1.PRE.2